MSFEQMEALEGRIKKLVDILQDLQKSNAVLKQDLQHTKEQLLKQEELSIGWEEERVQIRDRIEKVLGDLDFLDNSGNGASGNNS